MSTRGALGVRMNGIDKVGYNHFDSYFEGLGNELLCFLKGKNIKKLIDIYEKIEFVGNGDVWNWDKGQINQEFEDCHEFLKDSLFCEYAYIINLDTNKLEIYKGFNQHENADGRYAKECVDKEKRYFGVRLFEEIDLKDCFAGNIKLEGEKVFFNK